MKRKIDVYTPKLLSELKQYSREKAVADLFAGITVGIVALPLAMAFADCLLREVCSQLL